MTWTHTASGITPKPLLPDLGNLESDARNTVYIFSFNFFKLKNAFNLMQKHILLYSLVIGCLHDILKLKYTRIF